MTSSSPKDRNEDTATSVDTLRLSSDVFGRMFWGTDAPVPLDANRWQASFHAAFENKAVGALVSDERATLRLIGGAAKQVATEEADKGSVKATRVLRTSPQKLNLVAAMIRGKKVEKALTDLTFSKKRIAQDVKKCLQSAIANAENNHNLDVDELIVAEAYVGKNLVLKRGRPRARGRFGRVVKPFSELTIRVQDAQEQETG